MAEPPRDDLSDKTEPPPDVGRIVPLPLDYRGHQKVSRDTPSRLAYVAKVAIGFLYAVLVSVALIAFTTSTRYLPLDDRILSLCAILAISVVVTMSFRQTRGFAIGILLAVGTVLLLVGACFMIVAKKRY